MKEKREYSQKACLYMFLTMSGGKDIALANYGPAWRLHRKLFMTALRQYLSDVPLIERRVSEQVENLRAFLESKKGEPFDPTDILAESVANVICGITFGEGYDTTTNEDMRKLLELNKKVNGSPDMMLLFFLDFFPLVEYLPLPAFNRILELSGNIFDIIRKHLKERRDNFDPDERVTDLVTGLIQAQNQADDVQDQEKAAFLTDDYLVNTIEDMFSAGYETTSTTLKWAIAFLVNYPQFQVEIQQQLDEVVGRDRDPSLEDRPHLPLIHATIIEVLRLGNIAAQTIPHLALKDTKLCGYDVPKDTVIIVNTESVHLDPKCWENPSVFDPHRHIDENGRLNTNQGNFYPFGAGRRVCAGEPLAKVEVFLFLGWMLHRFKFEAGDEGPPQLKVTNIAGFKSPVPYKVRAIKRQ